MHLIKQLIILFGISFIAELVSFYSPVPLPAAVLAMLLLTSLLWCHLLKPQHIRTICQFLLKHMALFFIPAGVGILAHKESLAQFILPFLVIGLIATFLTFATTGLALQFVLLPLMRRAQSRRLS